MTCKRKDSHGKTAKRRNCSCPMDDTNRTSIGHSISLDEMVDDQNHQIANADQCRNAGIFKRVQASKVGERNDNQ